MISNVRYWFLLLLVLLVYVAGIFVNLFENGSAQYAVMATRIAQENNYFDLFIGSEAYLNRPYLHLWLSAFSFEIFGVHDWAYRIPGILGTLLAACSCFGLGKLLYNSNVGKLAALIFLTAQIIVISNTDVRAEAILTGFSIYALWQFAIYVEKGSLLGMGLGAIASGLTFLTSGPTGLLFIVVPLICHLIYTRNWSRIFNWRILIGALLFCISIAPIFYAFNLQSEKLLASEENQVAIFSFFEKIIFEPFIRNGFTFSSFDFFFFKSFLWTFLPWTIIGLLALISRFKSLLGLNFRYNTKYEFLSLGGIILLSVIFAFAQNKSHQSLNALIPLFSILVASYLYSLKRFQSKKFIKGVLGLQYFTFGLVFVVSVLLCYYVFKTDNPLNYIWKVALALLAIFFSLKREGYYYRLITVSVLCSLMINAVLNTHFFPQLLKYQAGSSMAAVVAEKEIPTESIYKLSDQGTWALDFYNKEPVKQISINTVLNKKNIWIYGTELQLRELNNLGYDWDRQYQVDQFRLNKMNLKFLDPATRKSILRKMYLIHIY